MALVDKCHDCIIAVGRMLGGVHKGESVNHGPQRIELEGRAAFADFPVHALEVKNRLPDSDRTHRDWRRDRVGVAAFDIRIRQRICAVGELKNGRQHRRNGLCIGGDLVETGLDGIGLGARRDAIGLSETRRERAVAIGRHADRRREDGCRRAVAAPGVEKAVIGRIARRNLEESALLDHNVTRRTHGSARLSREADRHRLRGQRLDCRQRFVSESRDPDEVRRVRQILVDGREISSRPRKARNAQLVQGAVKEQLLADVIRIGELEAVERIVGVIISVESPRNRNCAIQIKRIVFCSRIVGGRHIMPATRLCSRRRGIAPVLQTKDYLAGLLQLNVTQDGRRIVVAVLH